MGMGEIKYRGDTYTWANNKEREGFIQEILDRFFDSSEWMIQNDIVEVRHVVRQASDLAMIVLDSKPSRLKTRSRFIFETKWINGQECDDLIKEVWKNQWKGQNVQSEKKAQVV